MRRVAVYGVLISALLVFLGGCASQNSLANDPTTQPSGTVPGEQVSGEGGVTPGAGPTGASANVKW